jgi:hypothetical protein
LFANPIVITETATAITVTVTGSGGTAIVSGTTTSTNAYPTFTVGTATCSFNDYSFSGTRYYMKPMLRGAQIGATMIAGVETACTRWCVDGCWNTIAEFTVGASASAFDTANGWLTLADATSIYPTGISMSQGHYAFLLKRSTGATDVFNCTIAGNAITTTAAGVTTIGGTAYTGTALTSPVWLEFVATGTQIAVYSAGVLIGTKTGLTLAASVISMSRTTANIYVLAMNVNALESTSTNGIAVSPASVPHGGRYDTQEEAYITFTNAARYGEYTLAQTSKTTATPQTYELYFANTTDTTSVESSGLTTSDVVVTDTQTPCRYTDSMVPLIFRFQDRADTIKLSARRKNYSGVTYDNVPAVFVETMALAPIWEE